MRARIFELGFPVFWVVEFWQAVALAEVNCCVALRFKETVNGEIVWGSSACRVTTAEAEPPGPVAVTVTELADGRPDKIVSGYRCTFWCGKCITV